MCFPLFVRALILESDFGAGIEERLPIVCQLICHPTVETVYPLLYIYNAPFLINVIVIILIISSLLFIHNVFK